MFLMRTAARGSPMARRSTGSLRALWDNSAHPFLWWVLERRLHLFYLEGTALTQACDALS